ncbi:hypothetical protein [Nocardiopsis metallicus]|uniref:Uncharacterized protein n=1 Tax=Nocardiopsis metallicus TaxID=179819 RepID=A0A840WF72_9ACTN|nr:hypothetical protein [Nocardiopsis metallicus]MBB5494882.1 hypothetical protein [Nocardiopsis metallicus]
MPLHVWERRTEILAVFTEQNQDQAELPVFPLGTVIAGQSSGGVSSRFSPAKINPSLIIEKSVDSKPSQEPEGGAEVSGGADPVIAAVIEELAAHTGRMVSPAWAARCVSQIMRHRTVRHPVAYVVKSLQNAVQDGTLAERFMPSEPERTVRDAGKGPNSSHVPDIQLSPKAAELLGDAPWDSPGSESLDSQADPDLPWEPTLTQQTGASAEAPSAEEEEVEIMRPEELSQEIYRPGGRVLAGLGRAGALELVKLREQFAQRHSAHKQGTRDSAGARVLSPCS